MACKAEAIEIKAATDMLLLFVELLTLCECYVEYSICRTFVFMAGVSHQR